MKKLLALMLVICMVVGMVACGKPSAGGSTTPTGSTPTVDPNAPFKGKILHVYGLGDGEKYTDFSSFGKGNYIWMERAAVDEWAHINGVTIKYMGSYNQNQMLAAMNSGEKPDIFFQSNNFPTFANYGISAALTDEEYAELAAICGEGYLDLMNYKGKSHGFVLPWVGNILLYYNKSLFERLDVKSPKEYFMEGNWTWTTMQKCMEEVTRDLDGDGVTDIYGFPSDSWGYAGSIKQDETGRLVAPFDRDYQAYFEGLTMRYEQRVIKKTVLVPGTNKIQSNVTYPMYAMQSSDCEPYNFEHLYQTIPNGDELEVVPKPLYDGTSENHKDSLQFTQSTCSIGALCDEREAALDLLKYLLKCGLRYISDYSLGAVKCEYEGIQGLSEVSANWKEAFAQVCKDRAEAIKEIDFDQALMDKIYENMANYEWTIYTTYADVKAMGKYTEINEMPPASAIPAIMEKVRANLEKYNDLYVFD